MDFTGKAVLVTGSSRGIGKAAARLFLAHGARVAIHGRGTESVAAAIDELGGERLAAAPGDIATAAGCEAMVRRAVEALGGLDVLVNSAGLYAIASIAETDEATFDNLMQVNVKGTFFCSRAALPALRASRGSIVNLGSTAGLSGSAMISAYCASKGAIVNLTRAMAAELAPDIRVNCLCPGVVDTEMGMVNLQLVAEGQTMGDWYPMKRIATVEETAYAVLYLASAQAGFITGTALPLDGGALSCRG